MIIVKIPKACGELRFGDEIYMVTDNVGTDLAKVKVSIHPDYPANTRRCISVTVYHPGTEIAISGNVVRITNGLDVMIMKLDKDGMTWEEGV
jgi:hypothetical protein